MARAHSNVTGARRMRLAPPSRRLSMGIFWLLTAINFFNYLDRIIFVAIGSDLKHDFHLNDAQVGVTASAFLLVYTLAALPLGALADRLSRTRVIAIGVTVWSLATWYTAIAHSFVGLFASRAVLGIGEASYLPAGAALLAAYFAPAERATVQSRWGASSLVGTAAGFVLGGIIAQHFGWRWAFVLCGAPGLVLAWLAWRAPDRTAFDEADLGQRTMVQRRRPQDVTLRATLGSMIGQARQTLRSPTVRLAVVIQALALFVTTPALLFVPIHLHEHFHRTTQMAALLTGGVLVPAAIIGALLGGVLANALCRRFASGRLLASGVGFACSVPFFVVALMAESLPILLAFAFFAVVFMNLYTGPLNAAVQDVIPGTLRATAAAVIMTLAHLLGDVSSPTLVGALAGHMARDNVAHALVVLGTPALVLAAFAALWGAQIYARELRDRPRASAPRSTERRPLALQPHA